MMNRYYNQQVADVDEIDGEPLDVSSRNLRDVMPLERPGKDDMDVKHRCESVHYDSGICSVGSNFSQNFSNTSLSHDLSALRIHDSSSKTTEDTTSVDEGFLSGPRYPSEYNEGVKTKVPHTSQPPVQTTVHCPQPVITNSEELFDQDQDGDTQLHIAIARGASEIAMQIIEMAPSAQHLSLANGMRQTPLHLAVITDQADVSRKLVCHGAFLEARDVEGNTPMHIACYQGYLSCVKALGTPLSINESYIARQHPFQRIPQDMELRNYKGNTSMHLATQRCNVDVLNVLLNQPVHADVNSQDGCSGRTLLHYAVEANNPNLALCLINSHSANVNAMMYNGCTPLNLAVGRGLMHMAEILVRSGAVQSESVTSESESSDEEMEENFDDFRICGQPLGSATT